MRWVNADSNVPVTQDQDVRRAVNATQTAWDQTAPSSQMNPLVIQSKNVGGITQQTHVDMGGCIAPSSQMNLSAMQIRTANGTLRCKNAFIVSQPATAI